MKDMLEQMKQMEQVVAAEIAHARMESLESLLGLFRSAQVVDYPELREQMLRVEVGVRELDHQIETAIHGARQQVQETARELWRATLKGHGPLK